MAGKSIEESKQAYRDARRAKNGQASSSNATHQPNGKVPIKFRDKNGRAYITYIDSAETFSAEDTAPDAFVGVATDNANSIQPTAPDTVDYHGFMAFEELALRDELKATVDWNIRSRTPDAAALSVTTSQSDIPLSLEDHPFYCDTGASVHISPDKNDFSNLRLVPDESRAWEGQPSAPSASATSNSISEKEKTSCYKMSYTSPPLLFASSLYKHSPVNQDSGSHSVMMTTAAGSPTNLTPSLLAAHSPPKACTP